MDAVPFVISMKGPRVKKPVEQYDMLRSLREFLQWREGDSIILAEANVLPETDMEYFGEDGDRMHMMFNFQVNQNLFYALAAADCRPLVRGAQSHETAARDGAMGFVFAQSRRAGSRPLDRGATPTRIRMLRTRERNATL